MGLARIMMVCIASLVGAKAAIAQHTFPPFTLTATDAQQTEALPTSGVPAGTYWRFSATANWGFAFGGAWSSEARIQIVSQPSSGSGFPQGTTIYAGTGQQSSAQALASPQGLNNSSTRSLTWTGILTQPYVATGGASNPPLYVGARQIFAGTGAQWGNTSITLLPGATPPSGSTNLDPVTSEGTFRQAAIIVNASAIRWFRFTMPGVDRDAGSALDIDTEGTTLSGPVPANATSIALYNAGGLLIATDSVDGSGSLSQLTFGRGGRPATGTGQPYNGRDGATLPAGTYYLAVIGGSNAAPFANDFTVSAFSDGRSGTVNVRVRHYANFVPPPPGSVNLDPLSDGVFASAEAAVPVGGTPAWFRFTVPSTIDAGGPAALDIDTEFSDLGPVNGTAMGLYGSNGALLATDTGDGSGALAQLSFGAGNRAGRGDSAIFNGRDSIGPASSLPPGDYYLAVIGNTSTAALSDGFSVTAPSANGGTIIVRVRRYDQFFPVTPTSVDVGPLPLDESARSLSSTLDFGEVRWYRLALTSDVNSSVREYLDLDTEQAGAPCTAMALFADDAPGTLLITDQGDGSGCASQITIGRGTRPGVGDGLAYDGRDSTFLAAGTYLIAVGELGTIFADGFVAQSPGNLSGMITLNVRRGVQEPVTPTPAVDLGAISGAVGTYTTPGETLPFGGVVWYRFTTTVPTNSGEGYWVDLDAGGSNLPVTSLGLPFFNDTVMGIYSSTAALRGIDDDDGPNLLSGFTFGIAGSPRPPVAGAEAFDGRDGELAAGTWYVGVAQWESGFTWQLDDFFVAPVGTAGGTIRLNLRTNLPGGCNAADLTGPGGNYENGSVTVPADGLLTIEDFLSFLAAFGDGGGCPGLAPCNPADITGAGGPPTPPDGDLTIEDFLTFLASFGDGC